MKSIFVRFMAAFGVIILVSFLMLSSIVTVSIDDYAKDVKEQDMALVSQIAARMIEVECRESSVSTLTSFTASQTTMLRHLFATLSPHAEDTTFLITDAEGSIIYKNEKGYAFTGIEKMPLYFITEATTHGSYSEQTHLDRTLPRPFLINATAIRVQNNTIGAVFACSSNTGADALMQLLTRSIMLANLWIMLAVMIAVYFITERMITPLRQMSQATKEFAKGNFNTRIQVVGSDEIAEFAATFNQMAESLAQSETVRSTFLANVSHDLRTPMTTIAGYIDSILSGAIPPERQSYYLSIVSGEIHRLSRLVSQILDISRMEAGMQKFHPTDFDICEVARLILISFESRIDEKRLQIEFDADDDRMIAHADRDAIHQVLYNLCENAIKFSSEGGLLRISIRAEKHEKFQICVYNEGKGISEEDLPYIFDRFYKTDKSRGLDKIGVGLGLYIVKTMLVAQNESIRAESEEGKYCAFTFTLKRGG